MSKQVKRYVDDLFKGYVDTPALEDFKEEIISNLLNFRREKLANKP